MNSNFHRKHGFTLVEVLVASTITGFIALVAVGALTAITASSEKMKESINRAAEIRFAATTLLRDLVNVYRDDQQDNMEFIATGGGTGDGSSSYMLFYTISRAKARPDQPEGEIYEVEYYLQQEEGKSALMRRMWPNPDKEATEPGGILTAIAEDVAVFEVKYFDGEEWTYEWPEEMQSLPDLAEVTIVSEQPDAGTPVVESFLFNFKRGVGSDLTESETSEQTTSM